VTYKPTDIVSFFEKYYSDYAADDVRKWRDDLVAELERRVEHYESKADPSRTQPEFEFWSAKAHALRQAIALVRGES